MATIPREDYFEIRDESLENFWGQWWLSDSPKSNKLCCKENGDIYNTWQWFMLDMYFIWYYFYYYGESLECPIDAETSFWIWDECYENQAFTFDVSTVTDSGYGESIMTGGKYKEMILTIAANDENYMPYIWMQSGNGMCFSTEDATDSEIRFFTLDPTVNVDPGDGYYFAFGVSTPTPGIMDSVIDATPMSSPTPYDRNIYLKPSDYGKIKFGEYKIAQEPTITGYIEMVDKNGKNIKLAVIDYDDSYQEHFQPV